MRTDDLSRVNRAFFTANGFIGIGLFVFALADLICAGPDRCATAEAMRARRGSSGCPARPARPTPRAVLNGLLDAGAPVDLVVSRAARLTMLDETGLSLPRLRTGRDDLGRLARSRRPRRRAVLAGRRPRCRAEQRLLPDPRHGRRAGSTASVAGIAIGLSKDLLQRAADVTLKERRPLVVVPRETPFTRATLQHLLDLHDAGAVVLPASPGFYGAPQSVQQLVDFVAAKVLDVHRGASTTCSRAGPASSGAAADSAE